MNYNARSDLDYHMASSSKSCKVANKELQATTTIVAASGQIRST